MPRTPSDPLILELVQFLTFNEEQKSATEKANGIKANLMQQLENLMDNVDYNDPNNPHYKDAKGSFYYVLPSPVQVGDRTVSVLKREKRTGTYINDDKLLDKAESKGVRDRVTKMVEVVDQDEVYVLYAEGIFTEQDLDDILEEDVTYAFKPLAE